LADFNHKEHEEKHTKTTKEDLNEEKEAGNI
jgi:hypothetical protein